MAGRNDLLEARKAISGGMERVADRTIWQNELIWWLCRVALMWLETQIRRPNEKNY